jgi:hypothetical protein
MPHWLPYAESFVRAFLVPALASAAVLWLVSRTHHKNADRVAGALALAGGFFAGYVAGGVLPGWAPLVPTSRVEWSWLPSLALLAGLAGLTPLLFPEDSPVSRGATIVAALLVAGASAWLLVPDFESLRTARPYYVAGVAVAVFLLWAGLDLLADRQPGGRVPLLLTGVAVAAAAVLLYAGIASFTELAGVLVGTLAGAAVAAYRNPGRPYLRGIVPGFAVLLVGLLAEGYLNTSAQVPWVSFVLVALAPLLLWAGGRRGWLQAAAVLVPLAVAVALAVASAEGEDGSEDWSAAPAPSGWYV